MKAGILIIIISFVFFEEKVYSQNGSDTVIARNLGPKINSKANDFGAYIVRDGLTMYFVTNRSSKKDHLYFTKRKAIDSAWCEPEYFKLFNNQDNTAGIAFDDIGGMYCATDKNTAVKGDMNIWIGSSRDTTFVMKELPGPVNSTRWESQPSITRDGKDLYFASNRDAFLRGVQTVDIYVAHPNHDGSWSEPQDLGPGINIGIYNGTPFISPDGRFLFFSSKRKKGLDIRTKIYMAERTGPKYTDWSIPILLPIGINSIYDDLFPMVASDGKTIYFSSNRDANGFDIYEATLPLDIQSKIFHSFPGY